MRKDILLTSYGTEDGENRGIVILHFENNQISQELIPIQGKVNCCIKKGKYLYVPVKEAQCSYVYLYQKAGTKYELYKKIRTAYFYSYGWSNNENLLFLASFDQGVDAVLDVHAEIETTVRLVEKGQIGRSHFIGQTIDKKHMFSIDNGLQRITTYDVIEEQLTPKTMLQFADENIRLISYSHYADRYYLNTEKTNRIYCLYEEDGVFYIEYWISLLSEEENGFSGGNGISEDGRFLCVSIRGKNQLLCYQIKQNGDLILHDKINCGDMPRDLMILDDTLYVTCTTDNAVELYDYRNGLKKIDKINVASPITFALIKD